MIPDAIEVRLKPKERAVLESRLRAATTEQRQLLRIRIVLEAADGFGTREIARELDTTPTTVSLWRGRFARQRLDGLEDLPRSGTPPIYSEATDKRIRAVLDRSPPKGFARWNGPLIAKALGDVDVQYVWRSLRNRSRIYPALRNALSAIDDNYLNVQQDILETFVDRGQLRRLAEPTITPTGKRIPGLRLDHPRQLALMHALVRFAHVAAGNSFTTGEIHPHIIKALGCSPDCYTLASLRYDLSKLRAKGLVAKLPSSRRYQLLPQGYSICLVFLKLFERIYAPLTAGLLSPVSTDAKLPAQKRSQLDRLYHASSMILMRSSRPSASKPHDNSAQREQNSHCGNYNGLKLGL